MIENNRINNEMTTRGKLSPKIIGIVAAGIAGIFVAGTIIAQTVIPTVMPQVFVAEAFKTTQKTLEKEVKAAEALTGRNLAREIMQSEGMQTTFELKFENIKGEGAEYINGTLRGVGFSGEIKSDKEAENFFGSVAVNQNSLKLAGADFYKVQGEAGITIPKLFNQYIAVNLDTFVEDYNQSVLFNLTGQPLDEEAYYAFKDYLEGIGKQQESKVLAEKVEKRSEQAFKTLDVTYAGKTTSSHLGGTKTYRTYKIIFKEDDAKSYLKDIFSIYASERLFEDYIYALDAMQGTAYSETFSSEIKESAERFNEIIDQMQISDLKITLRIDDNKRIVEANCELEVTADDEMIGAALDIVLGGEKFISDETLIALYMKNEDNQADIRFTSKSNYSDGEGQLVHGMGFEISANQVPLTQLNLEMAYDTKAKENNLTVSASAKTPEASMLSTLVRGTMHLNKNSKAINLNMDEVTISFLGGSFEDAITFSGKYGVQTIKASDAVRKPDQDQIQYLFKMTEEELTYRAEQMYQNIMQLGSTFLP